MDRTSFDKIKRLLGKYLHQELTPEEQLQLDAWVAESADNRRFFERLSDSGHFEQEFRQFARSREAILSAVYQQIPALNKQPAKLTRLSFRRWWAAAAILLLLAGGTYLWIQPKKNAESEGAMVKTPEIAPGREGAILTLADGTQVVLDSLGNGLVAAVNGAQILLKNGQLAYDVTGEIAGHTTYNTVTTPKGRQFQIILPDGSKVWLNAASSIRYPTVFSGEERKVDVRGEAYFEVKQNPEMPFRVTIYNSAEVVVLGTQFNVDAYEEEQKIKTTLVEGSISVTSAGAKGGEKSLSGGDGLQPSVGIRPVVLKPGQQAQLLVRKRRLKILK
jgi:transmembrane sensor